MEAHIIIANDHTPHLELQEYTHFGNNINIFIKLYKTH